MEIVSLEPALEPIFWQYVSQDIPHYYFLAFDWEYNRDKTEILLGLEGDRIKGMMLVYDKSIVQLRGSLEIAQSLLELLDLEKVELQAPKEHKSLVLQKYKPTMSHEMMLMLLHRGEEEFHIDHPVKELDASDATEIAARMREADPEYWGQATSEQIADGMSKGANWFGIKVNEELVSIGMSRVTQWAGLIGVVATQEECRKRGYATSIVSELTRQILKERSLAMIYVLKDNPPAIKVYKRVGFSPYKTYFFMRGERR